MENLRIKTTKEFIAEDGIMFRTHNPSYRSYISDWHGAPLSILSKELQQRVTYSEDTIKRLCVICTPEDIKKYEAEEKEKVAVINNLHVNDKQVDFHSFRYNVGFKNIMFDIIYSPTGNCQLASIKYFYVLLDNLRANEIKIILKHIGKTYTHKKLYFVDVQQRYEQKLKEFDVYVPMQKYVSTNGSQMMYGTIVIY